MSTREPYNEFYVLYINPGTLTSTCKPVFSIGLKIPEAGSLKRMVIGIAATKSTTVAGCCVYINYSVS